MEVQLALAPDLNLSPAEFVSAWNGCPDCLDIAQAGLSESTPKGFPIDPAMAQGLLIHLAIAGGYLAADVMKDVLKDQVKKLVEEWLASHNRPAPQIEVQAIPQPGGAVLLVVKGENKT